MCSALCKDSNLPVLKLESGSGIARTVSLLELTLLLEAAAGGRGEIPADLESWLRLGMVSVEDKLTLWGWGLDEAAPDSCCSCSLVRFWRWILSFWTSTSSARSAPYKLQFHNYWRKIRNWQLTQTWYSHSNVTSATRYSQYHKPALRS